jgi:hypothetical protein
MDLKRLFTQVVYKIEAKPEGGFIARATDPAVPPLEAPTREELQQEIQQKMLAVISEEFLGSKVPPGAKHTEMSFHIEHNPGGGYSIHSSDPNTPVIQTANHQELESRFLEKVLGFADSGLAPELVKKLAAQVGSADVKVVVNRSVSFQTNSDGKGITFATPKSASLPSAPTQTQQLTAASASPNQLTGTIANNPITPEPSNAGKVFGLLLLSAILAAVIYLFLHGR